MQFQSGNFAIFLKVPAVTRSSRWSASPARTDLDAPDLNCRPRWSEPLRPTSATAAIPDRGRVGGDGKALSGTTLDPGASAALRDQLVCEVASLGSAARAAQWARTALPAKNTLTASDARLVEVAFELRLSSFETEGTPRDSGPAAPETPERAEPFLRTVGVEIGRRRAPQRPWQGY